MSSLAFLWPMAACAITGLALYVTRGVLDQTVTANGIVRFAMLPPWQALLGFICFGALRCWHRSPQRAAADHHHGDAAAAVGRAGALMFSSIVLLVPFADPSGSLAGAAGAGRPAWRDRLLGVGALQVWALWRAAHHRADDRAVSVTSTDRPLRRDHGGGRLAAEADGASLFPIRRRAALPLVMAQPVARSRSEDRNNHERGDYRDTHPI
jgi:hypothetical protein